MVLGVAYYVGDKFVIAVPANHFATGRAYNLFGHLNPPNSSN